MALFGNLKLKETDQKQSTSSPVVKSSGGLFSGLSPRPADAVAPDAGPARPDYFAAVDEKGNSFGFSDTERDPSGRPFFAFRKPGDTATTTDKTRVATTFDPRTPMTVDRDSFYNPRAVADVAALKKAMGGAWDDELDHKIALALSGSNDPQNLRPIPAKENDDSPIIMKLQQRVIAGEMSLFDAQVELAKKKGIDVPFTGKEKKSFLEKVFGGVKSLFQKGKEELSVKEAEASTLPSSSFLGGLKPLTPEEPKFNLSPSITGGPDLRTQSSTQAIPDETTPDTGRFLKSLVVGKNEVRAPFAKDTQTEEIGGGKIVSLATDMTSRLLEVIPKVGVITIANLRELNAATKGEEPKPVQLAFDATRLGFDKKDAVGNMIWSTGQRMVDDFNARMEESPDTPTMNIVSSVLSGPVLDTLDAIVAGDLLTAPAKAVLKRTGYNRPVLDALARFEVNPRELVRLTPSEARQVVVDQAKARITTLTEKYKPQLEAGGPLPDAFIKDLNAISEDLYRVGQGYFNTPAFDLGPIGKLVRETADTITRPFSTIGKEAPFRVGAEGAEKLPGYRKAPGQAPAFGLSTEEVEPVGFGAGKAADEAFQGFDDITTNVLNKLEGRDRVSKQFISDLTNSPDLKQAEKDIIRNVLNGYPEGTDIAIKEFAEKVRGELLPLSEASPESAYRYENISLPDESRGEVADYYERIYNSPIKTSAGTKHFSEATENYFAHSRIEDLPGDTRRIIEIQSDLFQKGGLSREVAEKLPRGIGSMGVAEETSGVFSIRNADGDVENTFNTLKEAEDALAKLEAPVRAELKALEPYRNIWHERIIREEVKKAALDGKETLQIPTGETAMKIEGLGGNIGPDGGTGWVLDDKPELYRPWDQLPALSTEKLKVGAHIIDIAEEEWVITDVLGDGKFKAVQKSEMVDAGGTDTLTVNEFFGDFSSREERLSLQETFDISGKIDTNNPIYRFYEKNVGRYLQNRYGAVRKTDAQGVSWWEFKVPEGAGEAPVVAFKRDIGGKYKPNITRLEAEELVYSIFDKDEIRLVFDEKMLDEDNLLGLFRQGTSIYSSRFSSMIKLLEQGGMVEDRVLYHEAFHAYFNKYLTKTERSAMIARVKNNVLATRHKFYPSEAYPTIEAKAEEWLADDFADYVKSKSGGEEYKGFFRRQFEKLLNALRQLIRKKEKFDKLYDDILNKKRGKSEPVEASRSKAAGPDDFKEVEKANAERNKILRKEAEAELPATKIEREILKKEKGLANEYRGAGKIKGQDEFFKADEHLSNISVEMSEAKPGERVFTGYGSDAKVEGVSSTFPKWVPEHLRSMDLFESVIPALDLQSLQFPRGSRQRELMNVVLGELDTRLGVDTSKTRGEIMNDLENLQIEKLKEKDERSARVLLNKGARQTDIEIAREEKRLALMKAEQETAKKLADELAYKVSFQERIKKARQESHKSKGLYASIKRALYPVQAVDKETKDILTRWFEKKFVANELADEIYREVYPKGGQNMQEIIAYESGKPIRYIREAMDSLGTEAKRRGLDFSFKDNYLSHIYRQDRKKQMDAIGRYLKDQGMKDEEIAEYLNGGELPKDKSVRLKLTPYFARARVFPTYSAAMKYGLTPKYRTPAQIIGHYRKELETAVANRELFEELKTQAKILLPDDAPDTWLPLNKQFSKETYYAHPDLAKLINGRFRDEDNISVYEIVAKGVGKVSRTMQEITLSAGVPHTNINYFSIGQAIRLLTTAVGEAAVGRFPEAITSLKASFSFIRANSNAKSAEWFYENRQYIMRMATEGIDVSGHVGSYSRINKAGFKGTELYSRWKDMLSETKTAEGVKDKTKSIASGIKDIIGIEFNKAFNEKTFSSMMAQINVQIFKDSYEAAIKSGLPEATASQYAGELTRAFGGLIGEVGRGKTTEETMSALLFAPKFREGLINIFLNSAKGFGTQFKNPAFRKNRALVLGIAITYILYNLLNKKMNDQYLWENPPGREFALRYEMDNGQTVYMEFMPSVLAFPRNMIQGSIATARGDFDMAIQKYGTVFSMPIKIGTELATNSDYFGREIYKETDSAGEKLIKSAQYVGLGVNHPFIRETWRWARNDQPVYQSISIAFELPFKYSTVEKEEKSEYYNMLDKQTKERTKAKEEVRKIYNKLQDMKALGQTEEADAIYFALPEDQRDLYDQVRADEKRKATNAKKPAIKALFDDLQDMKLAGEIEEANRIYWSLSDEDRKIYNSFK